MMDDPEIVPEDIKDVFERQQRFKSVLRNTGHTERIRKLKAIRSWIRAHRNEIREALYRDLHKPVSEADLWEMYVVIREINYAIRHLRRWMKPIRIRRDLLFLHARPSVIYEAKGQVLIIAPWNFPFLLSIGPLISAVAAGNCITLKPSELAPGTSAVLKKLVEDLFPIDEVAVFEGDKEIAISLLNQPFDHICFTGGTETGRRIMLAAAANMSSVTLELGGKCPAVVERTANLRDAVKKIAWGKFSNAGQTCVAPDYVLVEDAVHDAFIKLLVDEINQNYICPVSDPEGESNGMTRIIDEKHFVRLGTLFEEAKGSGAETVTGGVFDNKTRWIEPTVLRGVKPGMRLMREEIFGPILPVMKFSKPDEATEMINSLSSPLAVYIFSRNRHFRSGLIRDTGSGGVCLNDLVIQFVHPGMPFGGSGKSGIGRLHGYAGFKEFSNQRTILSGNTLNALKLLYPPITPVRQKLIDFLFRHW